MHCGGGHVAGAPSETLGPLPVEDGERREEERREERRAREV